MTAFVLAVGASAAWAQGDFQQRRPAPPDAGPPRPAPVLTKPPRVKVGPKPVYPPAAWEARKIADVRLQIDIDAQGRVTSAQVVTPVGDGFDEAAVAAATAMAFEPAEIDGAPGAIRIEYMMRFRPVLVDADGGVVDGGVGDGGIDAGDAGISDAGDAGRAIDLAPPRPVLLPLARGVVREKGTRDPLEAAEIRVERAGAPAADPLSEAAGLSDEAGAFVVMGTPGERVRVVVSTGAHQPCIRELVLPAAGGPPAELTCVVGRIGRRYETIVEPPRRGEEVTRHTLSQPELTSVPGTFGDPLRVIQNLPGVSRAPYGLGLLLIRGASPADSGTYIDGHRVPLLYHFAVGPSVLTPDLIDRIDFYPGGFGVRYGRASAGVVDVTTRTDPVKRWHGAADVDFLDAGGYVEGPVGGGFSAAAAARRSYVDTLLPLVLPEDVSVAAPVYWDYQARVARSFEGGERLSLFAFGSRDTLDVISSDPETGDIDLGTSVMFHRVIATWVKPLGAFTSRLSPSWGFDSIGFRAGAVDAGGSAHVFGLREELTGQLLPSLGMVVGLDGELRFDRVDFNVPLPPERRIYGRTRREISNISRTLTNTGLAGYAELLWDVHPRLRLVPGLRFDWYHYLTTDKVSWDPRIVARVKLAEGTAIKGGAGMFHQPPTPNQLDTEFGQPRLPLIYAHQYHLGFEHSFTEAIALDTTLFYMRRFDLPRPSARPAAGGGVERFEADGRGRGYGIEVLLKHRPTENFFGWIAYSFSRSEERRIRPYPSGVSTPYRPTTFDQTHNMTVVGSRTLGAWELGARFRLTTGIPDSPILDSHLDVDNNDYDPVRGPMGSIRRDTFHQLDLRVERTFTFDAWRFSLYLDVQNVYNAENPEATVYQFDFQKSAPVRGLPIFPVLGLRGRF